ncbi:MAG: DUF4251 domain-containing protein [Bacteroidia bacterium]|nr:DUF4251 domain-containing protein [Bacteroidia bacterium]
MKKIFIILSLIVFVSILNGQESPKTSLSKKEIRKKKKEEKEAKLQIEFDSIYHLLLGKSFVLEADYVENTAGRRHSVNYLLNFLMIDSENAVLQVGSDNHIGYNDMGGATAKGNITSYKLSRNDEHKSCSLAITVNTMTGHFEISFDIPASGSASAWVYGMNFGRIVFEGRIVPLKYSHVFTGRSL